MLEGELKQIEADMSTAGLAGDRQRVTSLRFNMPRSRRCSARATTSGRPSPPSAALFHPIFSRN